MELPHLSLYIRRALRRPSTGTMYIAVLWAAMFAARFTSGNQIILPAYYWMAPFDLGTLCILIGNFVLYFVIAQQMGRLVRGDDGRQPDWYATPLSDGAAVLGTLATTGLAALLPLVLLVVFVLLDARTAGTNWPEFGPALWFSLIRLPQFALLAACLQLVLRRSLIARVVPLLLALAAMLVAFWDAGLLYNYYYVPIAEMASPAWALKCLALALAIVFLLQLSLVVLARSTKAGVAHYALLGIAVLMPALVGLVHAIDTYTARQAVPWLGLKIQCVMHAAFAYLFPDIHPLYLVEYGSVYPPPDYLLYGWSAGLPIALEVLTGAYVVALVLWWLTAGNCLRMVRSPGDKPV